MTDHKHPSAAFWSTAALVAVLVMVYPLSIGPVCGWASNPDRAFIMLPEVYVPLGIASKGGSPARALAHWYVSFWVWDGTMTAVPMTRDGTQVVWI